jgi:hypothetical protein
MGFKSGDFAAFAFYTARFGTEGLPPSIVNALKDDPATSTRTGGSATIMAAR